jgi:putative transcriptional regulator
MSIVHHPSDETIAAYVGGRLDQGRHILVAAHTEMCPSCASMIAAADHLGGARLEALAPTPLGEHALNSALVRIDGEPQSAPTRTGQTYDLPIRLQALGGYKLGPWRWIGPGVHWRSVSVSNEGGTRVFMLRARPGTGLPHHTHTGKELSLVLKGAFIHGGGRFGVGDFDEADGDVVHEPTIETGEECICLVAMQGGLQLLSPLGRLLQPFIRL